MHVVNASSGRRDNAQPACCLHIPDVTVPDVAVRRGVSPEWTAGFGSKETVSAIGAAVEQVLQWRFRNDELLKVVIDRVV